MIPGHDIEHLHFVPVTFLHEKGIIKLQPLQHSLI